MSADDSEADKALSVAEAPDGVRRSGRSRSNKLKKANLKNDRLVSNILEQLEVGDVSSDELEGDQESDADEEVKE